MLNDVGCDGVVVVLLWILLLLMCVFVVGGLDIVCGCVWWCVG